ncbi:MAG: NACHT domain-containing protein [Thioploca sp.]|nr:NACHT domain-containing protein [Thioploca sp.]
MFKLKVFGTLQLTDTNQHTFKTAFPLLMAAYVVVEHYGEAMRDNVYNLFFPMLPIYPQRDSQSGKVIYEKLWKQGTNPQVHIAQSELDTFSDLEIEFACQELKKYDVIESYELKARSLTCSLTPLFKKYRLDLNSYGEVEKRTKIRKVCSQHIATIREFLTIFAPDEADKMLPRGKKGERNLPFAIYLNCDSTELEQALIINNFEQIEAIYCGKFLAGIEENVRATVWLPPKLRDWIENRRQDFAQQVKRNLLSMIHNFETQTENQRFVLARNIQRFYEQHDELYDPALQQEINKLLAPTNLEDLSSHLRNHLLAKMGENCHLQLKSIKQWINTKILVEILKHRTKESVSTQDSHLLLQIERSYNFIVLLGEAGMGKSLILYYIAQQLITAARQDKTQPIPLIFHLADWTIPTLSFEKWLKQELIQLGLAEKTIETDFNLLLTYKQCIFFLDGFDNLPPEHRLNSLKIINDFIQKQGEVHLGGIILASRPDEYRFTKALLQENSPHISHFYAEARLQPLSIEESRAYLTNYPTTQHWPIDTLFAVEAFRQLLSTPLSLVLLADSAEVQQIAPPAEIDSETIKNHLISSYVENCFRQAKHRCQEKQQKLPYTESEVTTWLGYIARSINIGSTFSVESLVPTLMLTKTQQYLYQRWFTFLFGATFGAMMGGIAGLIFGKRVSDNVAAQAVVLPSVFMDIHQILIPWLDNNALVDKIKLIFVYADIGMICGIFMSSLTFLLFKHINFSIFLAGYLSLHLGITGWLCEGSQWAVAIIIFYGIAGIIIGLLVGSKQHTNPLVIELHKETRLDYSQLFKQWHNHIKIKLLIIVGMLLLSTLSSLLLPKTNLVLAALIGIIIGISISLGYTFYHLRMQLTWQKKYFLPRYKIKAALERSISMILLIGGLITLMILLIGELITMILTSWQDDYLGWLGNLSLGLRIGMPMGITIGFMSYGGVDVLKHLTLRLVMYRYEIAPWHYTRFLEYAKYLTFLKSQSGDYAFRHDWFQVYFSEKGKPA